MKKVTLLVFLFFLVIHLSYSQNRFGLKAGANLSAIKANEAHIADPDKRLGYHLGFWKEYAWSPKFFLRPELFYSLKGYKYANTTSSPLNIPIKRNGTISYNYITLPLLVGYRPTANLAIYVGPEISALGAVRGRSKGGRGSNLRAIVNYNTLDVGLTAGMLYKLTSRISTDFRYTYGFSTVLEYDVSDTQGQYEYTIRESRNKAVQLRLNYTLKKKG